MSGGNGAATQGRVRWGRFFSINTDLFFRSACIMGVTLAMTSIGARIGETTLAANAVVMQFFLFFSYFMDGFAFSAEALVGNAAGRGEMPAQRQAVGAVSLWGAAMAAAFALIYVTAAGPITGCITDDATVRAAVAGMRWWITALPPVTVAWPVRVCFSSPHSWPRSPSSPPSRSAPAMGMCPQTACSGSVSNFIYCSEAFY